MSYYSRRGSQRIMDFANEQAKERHWSQWVERCCICHNVGSMLVYSEQEYVLRVGLQKNVKHTIKFRAMEIDMIAEEANKQDCTAKIKKSKCQPNFNKEDYL